MRYGRDEYADIATIENHHMAYNAGLITEPKSLSEALTTDYAKKWKMAADLEYKSLMENKTWELVELPCGRSQIGCKWVFKVKRGSDGNVECFKGCLVAKGYAEKFGIDNFRVRAKECYYCY